MGLVRVEASDKQHWRFARISRRGGRVGGVMGGRGIRQPVWLLLRDRDVNSFVLRLATFHSSWCFQFVHQSLIATVRKCRD